MPSKTEGGDQFLRAVREYAAAKRREKFYYELAIALIILSALAWPITHC